MSLRKIREAVQAAKGNARQMGEVVLMIAQADEHAAEVIAADLDNPEMSLQKCFDALYEHAKKNQKGGFWGCMCNRYDPDNPVIQVVAEFYRFRWIPKRLGARSRPERTVRRGRRTLRNPEIWI